MKLKQTVVAINLLVLLQVFAAVHADVSFSGEAQAPAERLSLWYRRPANRWTEALPIGNGRLGAMVFGGVGQERLQLNEDTLWAGGPYDPVNPSAKVALPEVRQLIFDGKYSDAARLISRRVMARPLRQLPYQTVGDVLLRFSDDIAVGDYRRELNLDSAVARVSYVADGTTFVREAFASPVDQVIAVRLTASRDGQISFAAGLRTPQDATITVEAGDTLVLRGVNGDAEGIKGALTFQARVRVVASGGETTSAENEIVVRNADSALILIAAATSFKKFNDVSGNPQAATESWLAAASKKDYDTLLKRT